MAPPKNTAPPSRTVVLKLSSTVLRRFPHESTPTVDDDDEKDDAVKVKDASSPPSSTSGEAGLQASLFDAASDAASTPAAAAAAAAPAVAVDGSSEGGKAKKGGASTSANGTANGNAGGTGSGTPRGTKRALEKTGDGSGAPKAARSRPTGPKKRLKLDDKSLDSSRLMPPGHKLGPKANQGAINAGLRALDRSGAPCRKWERKSFQLKSFTGVVWGLSSWHTPKPPAAEPQLPGESSSGADEATPSAAATAGGGGGGVNGDSDSVSKTNLLSSAVPSEKSNAGDVGDGDVEGSSMPPSTAASPLPVATASA